MSTYTAVLLISLSIPLLVSFWPGLRFYRKPLALLYSLGLIVTIFGIWDVYATWRGHWVFNPAAVAHTRVINLPVEEVLFFIVIPFCCIFTWEVIKFIKGKIT